MLKTDVPHARVSEDSRQAGRHSIPRQVEALRRELNGLTREKKNLEGELSEIQAWKRTETATILSSRFPKSRAIELTARLESDVVEKRRPVLVQFHAIEERIHAIKSRLKNSEVDPSQVSRRQREEREEREKAVLSTLQSIENLLRTLVAKEKK